VPAVVAGAVALALVAGACTPDEVDPERTRTVIVAVDTPFASLNAGLPEGRTSGSTLIRGLVQDGLVGLDEAGAAVLDTSFGTVEKVSDAPLVVRYTIAEGARWSDGTAVSPADLLLEWAARSGQFDEASPEEIPAAEPTPTASVPADPSAAPTSSAAPTPSVAPTPTPSTMATPGPAEQPVRFGATSAALLAAGATPTFDGTAVTVVYGRPVADWQVALDVNLPAHVVGRLALADQPTTTPDPASSPADAAAPAATPATPWADDESAAAVAQAITTGDRAALARIAEVWRTGFDAESLAADPARAVTTGPYRIAAFDPAGSVELVGNDEYAGARPASREKIVVRWDLDPLAAVEALTAGDVDVAAPVVTPDVTAALNRVPDVLLRSGGGPVFQLVLNEATGPFAAPAPAEEAPEETAAPTPGATPTPETTRAPEDTVGDAVATLRATFLASVPGELDTETGAERSLAVLATLGPGAVTDPPVATGGAGDVPGPVEVRVLVATGDPVRAALFEALTAAASAAGFELVEATTADPATALWEEPEVWDAAIVPVTQAELPIAGTVDRWRSGGATNVSGHADPALDAILDQLAGALAPAAVADLVGQTGAAVRDASVVVPLVRQPSVAATVDRGEDSDLPAIGEVGAVPWGLVDLSAWWSWAVTAPAG